MNQQLQVISPGAALPVSLYGKKVGGIIGQQLHVFALNSPPDQVRHIAVSLNGEITHNAVVLQDAMAVDCSVQSDHALLLARHLSTSQLLLAKIAENGVFPDGVCAKWRYHAVLGCGGCSSNHPAIDVAEWEPQPRRSPTAARYELQFAGYAAC